MPVATTSGSVTQKFDLKTVPEGFVVIRRMTYGEFLSRRAMTSKLAFEGSRNGNDSSAVMEIYKTAVTEFEFKNCIMDHNLTDSEGRELDFRNPMDIQSLDPRVGEEIATRIDEVNQFLGDGDNGRGN